MDHMLWRWLRAVLMLSTGGALGYAVGSAVNWQLIGIWLGVVLGILPFFVRDARRTEALMRWLRSGDLDGAPRVAGPWGELAYRIERTFRMLDQERVAQAGRLRDTLSAIDASPNGVLLLDGAMQIVWCNIASADHFGLDAQRDRGQPVTNLVRMPAFVAMMQGDGEADTTTVHDARSARTLQVLVRRYSGTMHMVLSQDVTERLQAEAMRRDFVANVSHEIRTPLTVLAGFVETLRDLPLSPAERQRVLALMGQQTDRMQSLVSDLLTLARLEGSPRPAADQWLQVSVLLRQVEVECSGLSRGRHVLVFPDLASIEDQGFSLAGSRDELLSAMVNLASNAVRYTPEGGRIEVQWSVLDDGRASFAVLDTGVGIGREHLPRLTQRFYRVDGSRSRETGGTGLGLSIVKHVLQRHGADLQIESEPGQGSVFRIVFPSGRLRIAAVAGQPQGEAAVAG